MKTISIHQPNFLPWLGYFYKISQSDVFVILDDVDFQRGNATSLTNRTRLKGPNGPFWLTVPVKSKNESSLIKDIQIDNQTPWFKSAGKTLANFYAKCPFYDFYHTAITGILTREYKSLSQLNIDLILFICEMLEIKSEILTSSSLNVTPYKKDEKIIEICRTCNATHYLSGSGARKYNRPELFDQAGIELIYTGFIHPVYPQRYGEFIPGLSILDVLFNYGPATREFLTPAL